MVNAIVAVGPNWEIGSKGGLPWGRNKEDMAHFRDVTLGHTIIMGRSTFESMGSKPLKGRRNIVISSSLDSGDDFEVYTSIGLALNACEDDQRQAFIIGGERLYEYSAMYADKIYITHMPAHLIERKGDRFFKNNHLLKYRQVQPLGLGEQGASYDLYYHSSAHDNIYADLLREVLVHGQERSDRTGTGTKSIFGMRAEYDLREGFPLITTKRVFWRGVVAELLWMISGDTSAKTLSDQGVHIWDAWADDSGELGPVYGRQWRSWDDGLGSTIDQLEGVIEQIKSNPDSRRHIISAWNVGDLDDMALAPCHMMFQFYVCSEGYLDLQLYQRSADLFLGVPFNIASYSLLLMIVARLTGLKPRKFIHVVGDAHIYLNHIEQVKEQLSRDAYWAPKVFISKQLEGASIDDISAEHISLIDYQSHKTIKGSVSV